LRDLSRPIVDGLLIVIIIIKRRRTRTIITIIAVLKVADVSSLTILEAPTVTEQATLVRYEWIR